MPDPLTPERIAEIRRECAPLMRDERCPGGRFRLPFAKDHIAGQFHEDGSTFYIRLPASLRAAMLAMLESFPALLAEVARLQASVAELEDALRVSHEFLVKFERAGDRIICSAEGGECPAWWNEHFDALHGKVECWTASAQLHAAIDAPRKEAPRG